MDIEDSFPRGSISHTEKKLFPDNNSFQLPIAKRKRSYSDLNDASVKKRRVFDISYAKIEKDMILLACVRSISAMAVEVELPGKMCGRVNIVSVSDPLTKLLEEEIAQDNINNENFSLDTIFCLGQFIATKVIEKNFTEKGTKLLLSTNPVDINQQWNYANFVKGRFIWAAVELELEHGYQLTVGVNGCKVFLPHKNKRSDITYVVGQPLYCIIKKSTVDPELSTIVVSTLEKDMCKTVSKDNADLLHLIPGSLVNFTITNVLENGLQGIFLKQNGFIFESYLDKFYEDESSFRASNKSGDTIKAFLLYVQTDKKYGYFCSRDINFANKIAFANGSRLNCYVLKSAPEGIYVKLSKDDVGLISYKRFGNQFKNYPVGTQQNVLILDYRRFEKLYICTFLQNNCDYTNVTEMKKLEIGELVTGKVLKISNKGVAVRINKLKGFLQTLHLEDHRVKVGDTIRAKVWNIKNGDVYLTAKKMLLDSNVCLNTCNDVDVGKQYPGVVLKKNIKGILVLFYGDTKGILSKPHLTEVLGTNAYDSFREGEVIWTRVTKSKGFQFLELKLVRKSKTKIVNNIKIGEYITAKVTKVYPNGLEVKSLHTNDHGFIPTAHLGACYSLTSLLLKSYKIGDVIENLLCVSTGRSPILSIREAKAYQYNNQRIMSMADLEIGTIIRCNYLTDLETRIRVSATIIPECKILHIYNNDLDKDAAKNYKYQQVILAKVTKFNREKNLIKVTARSEHVCEWNYENALDYLEQYLKDVESIDTRLNDSLAISKIHLGQRLQCTIKAINKHECSLLLVDNMQGIALRQQARETAKVGDSVEGVVLWKDFVEDRVILSLKKDVIDRINEDQGMCNVHLETSIPVCVLLIKSEFIITVSENKQLIFVPILQPNFYLRIPKYKLFQKINVFISRKIANIAVGVDKFMLKKLNKAKEAFINRSPHFNSTTFKAINSEYDKEREQKDQNEKEEPVESLSTYNTSQSLNEIFQNGSESVGALPGVDGYFILEKTVEFESSSEEEVTSTESIKKKKKLTAAERTDAKEVLINRSPHFNSATFKAINSEYDKKREQKDQNEKVEPVESLLTYNTSQSLNEIFQNGSESLGALPGVDGYFTLEKTVESESSSEEEATPTESIKKKKKLTAAERTDVIRQTEERIRRKEIELADGTSEPQSEEQFERLVTSKPNSSELWAKYIAYCVSNAEIHKARNIAKAALKRIDLNHTEERYNIWITYLNLENNYGDKESFNGVFEEAVRCNDDLQIYLDVISLLAHSEKYTEMNEKIKKVKNKHKHNPKMWISLTSLYYKIGQLKDARNTQSSALKTIERKSNHVFMIVQFGIMEFNHGERHHAEALFETILQAHPKRVDVWSAYVDQMIKKENIDGARRILDRAISQQIPLKKMKAVFKKYKDLELKYGDEESVEHVIELARQYIGDK